MSDTRRRFVLSSDVNERQQDNMSSDLVPAYDGDYQVVQLDDRMQVEDQNPGLQVPTEQKEKPFAFDDYVAMHSPKPSFEIHDFCQLSSSDQKKVVFWVENLPLDAYECRELPDPNAAVLRQKLRNGTERRGVYSSSLEEDVVVVQSKSCFPTIAQVDVPTGNLLDQKSPQWFEWINSTQVYSLEPKPTSFSAESFRVALDIDATVMHSNSLNVLQQSFTLYLAPKYNSWANKIKHVYKGTTLHNVVNVEIGKLDETWKIYVCFLDCPKKSFSHPKDLIEEFYFKFMTGIINGPQAGQIDVWKNDVRGYVKSEFNKAREFPVQVESIPAIEMQLGNFTYNDQRIRLCFTYQYFGQKQIVDRDGFIRYMSRVSSLFKLSEIMDPKNHLFSDTLFFQDIAFTITPPADYRCMLSFLWSPEFIKKIGVISESPLSKLLVYNERHPMPDGFRAVPTDGTSVSYPNLGIGQISSCMIDWRSTQYAIREVKVYSSASQIWCNNAPYDGTCYSVGAFPFEVVLSGSSVSPELQKSIIARADYIAHSFETSKEKRNIERIVKSLKETTAGIRLEVSFQNLGVHRLIEAYDELSNLAKTIINTHLSLHALTMQRLIPHESLRLSPIQVVSSESVALMCEYQALNLHAMFVALHGAAVNNKFVLNLDAINALSLLEDLQQFLWSGSIPTLHNPSLFKSLKTIGWLAAYNKVYVPSSIFSFNWQQPLKTKCELPLLESRKVLDDEEEDARDILAPQLGLTKRFLYQAFGLNGNQLADISAALSTGVKLHAEAKNNLFQPLYRSKSMILAANLLNILFETCFEAMTLRQSKYSVAMKQLVQQKRFMLGEIKCSDHKTTIARFIKGCFPLEDPSESVKDKPFYKRWLQVKKEVANMSEEMHFNHYQGTDDKNGDTYPVLPGITVQDVVDQMTILLHCSQVHWVPALGGTILISKVQGFYLVDQIVPQYQSDLFISSLNTPHGAPLPHPVDNSFIFMMAKRVAKKIEKEREAEILQFKRENPAPIRKRGQKPVPNLFALKQRDNQNLTSYKAHEIIGHILFQYFHKPMQSQFPQNKFKNTVHYGNVTKKVLLSTGMLTGPDAVRASFATVSKNEIWRLYKNE